jgi:hypothetical protein
MPDPAETFYLHDSGVRGRGSYLSLPYSDYKDYRYRNQSLAGLAAYSMMPVSLSEAVSRHGSERRDECRGFKV